MLSKELVNRVLKELLLEHPGETSYIGQCISSLQDALNGEVSPAWNLVKRYGSWGSHPIYSRREWMGEVSSNETNLGYWDWVIAQMENEDEDDHFRRLAIEKCASIKDIHIDMDAEVKPAAEGLPLGSHWVSAFVLVQENHEDSL